MPLGTDGMIFNHSLTKLERRSVQYRLHLEPHYSEGTMGVILWQVPPPALNPGGHLAYLSDRQVCDLPVGRPATLTDVYGMVCEATMQVRLPGLD